MASEYIMLRGKCKFLNADVLDPWGKWSFLLYLDNESLKIFNSLKDRGLKNELKKDDDGYYVRLSRQQQKFIRGKPVIYEPPKILEADGQTPARERKVPDHSNVCVELEIYEHATPGGGRAIASRWVSTIVEVAADPTMGVREQRTKELYEQSRPGF